MGWGGCVGKVQDSTIPPNMTITHYKLYIKEWVDPA